MDGTGRRRGVAAALIGLAVSAGMVDTAQGAPTAAPDAAVSEYARGFEVRGRFGPIGIAFDGGGTLYVGSWSHLYRVTRAGTATRVNRNPYAARLMGLAFGRRGELFAARRLTESSGDIVELDPRDGRVLRTVVGGLTCPTAVAVDPRSGDLFFSEVICREAILRFSRGRVTTYTGGVAVDGLTFAPGGTLYAAHEPDADGYTVSAIAGTATATPGARTPLARVPAADGAALARGGEFLVVNRTDGAITRVELPSGAMRDLVTGGSRGDLVAAGPDGCLYATQTDSVLRVTNADGSCGSAGASVEAGIGAGLAETTVEITPGAATLITFRGGAAKNRSCRSNRRIRVRFRSRSGVRVISARIFVRGRPRRRVSGAGLRRGVTLRRLPARRFTVTIRAVTRSGRRTRGIVVRKRYGRCAGRTS